MTNQQGAPEALEDHQVRKLAAIGAVSTSSGLVERRPIEYRRELENQFVRGFRAAEERLAALVEAQQPAAHVQNPGEIEHVVGDVSKNGPGSNMAQQAAPSAAAGVNPDPHAELRKTWQPGQRWQARSFRNGQWGPWTDAVASEPFWFPHQDYRRHPDDLAPQPSPTPQADSQPAPVEVADAMADSQYLAGVSAGWNAANADDPNAALRKLHESRAGYLKPLSAARAPADSGAAPIDMVLHCPKCGLQHIDAPDWQNDPQLGAIRYANAKQRIDTSGDREAQQSHHEPVQVLLRDGGMASGGHAEQPVQEVQLPATAIHEANKGMHVVSAGNGRFTVLQGQQNGQPSSEVQGLPQERNRRLEEDQSGRGESGGTPPKQSAARDEAIRLDARGVSGAPESSGADLQHLREGRAPEAQEGPSIAGSLPCNGQDSGRAVLSLQHDAGLRERRLNVASQRDQVSCEAPLRAPIHRSHLCRPEDGGCGHIWRPADVPTNGVKAVKTTGKADSPIAARAPADSGPAWASQAVIEYRYTGGTHWCPLGPAERMKPNFDGVYRLQGGVFPVEAPADSVTAPAAYSGNLEQELAMLIRRIVSSARRNCEDGSNVLKLANEAWAYLVRKGLNGSPLRDAGIETAPTPPAQAADSVLEDAELGRIAMRFVDRAGDPHPGIDDAETICREFHAAMSAVLDTRFQRRMDAARKQGGKP